MYEESGQHGEFGKDGPNQQPVATQRDLPGEPNCAAARELIGHLAEHDRGESRDPTSCRRLPR